MVVQWALSVITSGNVIMNLIGKDCQIQLNWLPGKGSSFFVVSIQLNALFKKKSRIFFVVKFSERLSQRTFIQVSV